MKRYLLLLIPLLALSCGPIRSTVGIIEAEQTLKAAREAGAEEHAAYPMALAGELLRKAIEEQGYASYFTSWQFAVEAKGLAEEALALVPAAEPTFPAAADAVPDPDPTESTEPPPTVWGDDDDSAGEVEPSGVDDDDSADEQGPEAAPESNPWATPQ